MVGIPELKKLQDILWNAPKGENGETSVGTMAEFLLKNGIRILPIPLGITVYKIYPAEKPERQIVEWVITQVEMTEDEIVLYDKVKHQVLETDIGETVFLSKAEAEKALKECKEMTDRERLKQLLINAPTCDNDCYLCEYKYTDDKCEEHLSGIMADHLLSKGVVYPRCKVGDLVYCINQRNKQIFHSYIKHITITTKGLSYVTYWDSAYYDEDFGEVIFLSEEEAEKALGRKERKGVENNGR